MGSKSAPRCLWSNCHGLKAVISRNFIVCMCVCACACVCVHVHVHVCLWALRTWIHLGVINMKTFALWAQHSNWIHHKAIFLNRDIKNILSYLSSVGHLSVTFSLAALKILLTLTQNIDLLRFLSVQRSESFIFYFLRQKWVKANGWGECLHTT